MEIRKFRGLLYKIDFFEVLYKKNSSLRPEIILKAFYWFLLISPSLKDLVIKTNLWKVFHWVEVFWKSSFEKKPLKNFLNVFFRKKNIFMGFYMLLEGFYKNLLKIFCRQKAFQISYVGKCETVLFKTGLY